MPSAVPDEKMDGTYLALSFETVQVADIEKVASRDWDPMAYMVLSTRFRLDSAALKALRVFAMVHTLGTCKKKGYTTGNSFKAIAGPTSNSSHRCGSYRPQARFPETRLLVANVDSITAAQQAVAKLPPLNNRNRPGGGWAKGSSAQEKDLFRRTTLSAALVEAGWGLCGWSLGDVVCHVSFKDAVGKAESKKTCCSVRT